MTVFVRLMGTVPVVPVTLFDTTKQPNSQLCESRHAPRKKPMERTKLCIIAGKLYNDVREKEH
jgi:hypothetical protein